MKRIHWLIPHQLAWAGRVKSPFVSDEARGPGKRKSLWLSLPLHLALVAGICSCAGPRHQYWIGYSDKRCDDPRGQFYNGRTQRAMIVRADGTDRHEVGTSLIRDENSWTQFVRWWPDGRVVLSAAWESPENADWEHEHKTFRFDKGGWLTDVCLVDVDTGKILNLSAVERISHWNAGMSPWPGDNARVSFVAMVDGASRPFIMGLDGRNKRQLVSGEGKFVYGVQLSPDGRRMAYLLEYKLYLSDADGSNARRVDLDREHEFQFAPAWSPDGRWLEFLAGKHYDCHPYLVSADGARLRKLADRGGYPGVIEVLDYPDFHSDSSDVPVWSPDSRWLYYTAKVGEAVELMRVSPEGQVQQLTHSKSGSLHYHPQVSPDGRLVVFGSTRDGARALYVADADGGHIKAVTVPQRGRAQMWANWRMDVPVAKNSR